MLQLQVSIEEERCRVLQIDRRLEEILETSSYFVDRSQDILEVLTARMERLETNEEAPAELPSKDRLALMTYWSLPSTQPRSSRRLLERQKGHVHNSLEDS